MERGKRTLTAVFDAEDAAFVRFCAGKANATISALIECIVMHDLKSRPQIVKEYNEFLHEENEKRENENINKP